MLANDYVEEFQGQIDRPANDLFGALDPELWEPIEGILNCADFTDGLERYEASLFRFPAIMRQYFAAMCYLNVVEQQGHSAYFSSAYAYGFDEAVACFAALGRFDITMLMEDAAFAATQVSQYATGAAVMAFADPQTEYDLRLSSLGPTADLRRFPRRNPDVFDRW